MTRPHDHPPGCNELRRLHPARDRVTTDILPVLDGHGFSVSLRRPAWDRRRDAWAGCDRRSPIVDQAIASMSRAFSGLIWDAGASDMRRHWRLEGAAVAEGDGIV
jgi:hypothetical protein